MLEKKIFFKKRKLLKGITKSKNYFKVTVTVPKKQSLQ